MHTAKLAVDIRFRRKISGFRLDRPQAQKLDWLTFITNTSYLFSAS